MCVSSEHTRMLTVFQLLRWDSRLGYLALPASFMGKIVPCGTDMAKLPVLSSPGVSSSSPGSWA